MLGVALSLEASLAVVEVLESSKTFSKVCAALEEDIVMLRIS